MDAVKFLKETKRMCDSYKGCSECPIGKEKIASNIFCHDYKNKYPEKFVEKVSEWSRNNPQITNRKKFLEVFGITIGDAMLKPNWADNEYKENK